MKLSRIVLPIFCLVSCASAMQESYLRPDGGPFNNPVVEDIEQAFNNISPDGLPIHAMNYRQGVDRPAIPDQDCRYRDCMVHNTQLLECVGSYTIWSNGFRGIARFSPQSGLGNFLLVTGSNPHNDGDCVFGPTSHLFIVKMPKRVDHAGPVTGSIHDVMSLTNASCKGFYYAGALQTCGRYFAVPLFNGESSKVFFYKCHPIQGEIAIQCLDTFFIDCGRRHCRAVAMARLFNGHYLVAIACDDRIVFFVSNDTSVESSFKQRGSVKVIHCDAASNALYNPGFCMRSMSFVNGIDRQLYLITTHNTHSWLPMVKGTDFAVLFRVELPEGAAKDFALTHVAERVLHCGRHADFHSAGGICVLDQHHVAIYGAYPWLKGWNHLCHNFRSSYISMMQFAPQA